MVENPACGRADYPFNSHTVPRIAVDHQRTVLDYLVAVQGDCRTVQKYRQGKEKAKREKGGITSENG